jgi:hypothetical protein
MYRYPPANPTHLQGPSERIPSEKGTSGVGSFTSLSILKLEELMRENDPKPVRKPMILSIVPGSPVCCNEPVPSQPNPLPPWVLACIGDRDRAPAPARIYGQDAACVVQETSFVSLHTYLGRYLCNSIHLRCLLLDRAGRCRCPGWVSASRTYHALSYL